MYRIRLSVEDKDILKFVDFNEASKGIIRLKANKDLILNSNSKRVGLRYPIKIETFIDRKSSVGMVFLDKTLSMLSMNSIQLTNFGIKDGIKGTLDFFNPHFSLVKGYEYTSEFSISKNDSALFIRFVTEHYHKLLLEKDVEGIKSDPIEIQVFINGKFKPMNNDQLISNGYEIIDKIYNRTSEFYDLEFINAIDNPNSEIKTLSNFNDIRYEI